MVPQGLIFRPILTQDIDLLSRSMATSDPWLKLGIDQTACRRTLSNEGYDSWVADLGGQPVGFVLLQMKGAFSGYIVSIMIVEAHRGQGIGAALLEFAEQRVFGQTKNMFLCVSAFNHRAQAFYRLHGYDTIGVIKNYLVEGEDEILMRKTSGPLRSQQTREG